jgi:hypothetical protein
LTLWGKAWNRLYGFWHVVTCSRRQDSNGNAATKDPYAMRCQPWKGRPCSSELRCCESMV